MSCTPDVEILGIQCRPSYLPREVCCVVLIVVYVAVEGNAARAMNLIASVAENALQDKPDAAVIITGDFNRASLSERLPSFSQYVHFPTRENRCLDHLYCNMKGAYKTVSLPPIGRSDHCMILSIPTYIRRLEAVKPTVKTIKMWTEEDMEQLGGCFACTDWLLFEETSNDINEFTEVVTDYIKFCEDNIIQSRSIKVYGNNRPWVTKDLLCAAHRKRKLWRTGRMEEYRVANEELQEKIRNGRQQYKQKIERSFTSGDSQVDVEWSEYDHRVQEEAPCPGTWHQRCGESKPVK